MDVLKINDDDDDDDSGKLALIGLNLRLESILYEVEAKTHKADSKTHKAFAKIHKAEAEAMFLASRLFLDQSWTIIPRGGRFAWSSNCGLPSGEWP